MKRVSLALNKVAAITTAAALTVAAALTACSEMNSNPLLGQFDTPYQLPPFEKIKAEHYIPAVTEAIDRANKAVDLIAANRADPTFENTIIPFDRRNERLNLIVNIFFNVRETDLNDSLNVVAEELMPLLTKYEDDVFLNGQIFNRIKRVRDTAKEAGLDSSQMRVVNMYYRDFVRHGALLSPGDKEKLREVNQELSTLGLKFGTNLLAETNKFKLVIDTASDLVGLPDDVVAAAAKRAAEAGLPGKWVFGLQKASMIPFLTYSARHDLRKKLYDAYTSRADSAGPNDNRDLAIKMATLRAKRAALLGYKNHAQYVIEENMAARPEAADSFLMELWQPALRKAKNELQEMKNFAWRYDRTGVIEACDWFYWAEKLRKSKYDLNETEISEYFALENVRQGMFDVANKLYGVNFKKIDNAPLYNHNASIVCYEVTEADGTFVGTLYHDPYPRDTKGAGAWCTSFRDALDNFDGTRQTAQVQNVCNFTPPVDGKPALLTFDEVETIFHEFGHALHALFSRGCYHRTCGDVPRDYVELPSQIMEHWPSEPECLKQFARHYKTGEVIPDALIEKIKKAGTFNQGFATVEYLAASLLDLKWHSIDSKTTIADADAFEAEAMKEIGLIPEILPRYRSTYFAHIFDGGYSAGYYVYIWAELLDCDAYAAYKESGDIYNREIAARFRRDCLEQIGEADAMSQYLKFRGQKPDVKHLIEKRGLNERPQPVYRPQPVLTQPAAE